MRSFKVKQSSLSCPVEFALVRLDTHTICTSICTMDVLRLDQNDAACSVRKEAAAKRGMGQ